MCRPRRPDWKRSPTARFAENDTIAPVGPALRVAERGPKAEVFRSRGDHYGVYEGGEDLERTPAGVI
jgi:hypothetical protein